MFEECWNENCFFYGTSDTYVQEPSRFGHERRSLIRTEKAARSPLLGVKEDDFLEEDEEFREHVYDDDDMFLYNHAVGILSLPSFLRSGCKTWKVSSLPRCQLADYRRAKMRSESLGFFSTMVYAGDSKSRLRYEALDRACDAIDHVRHGALFLDYLSIIRCCVVSDRATRAVADHHIERPGLRTRRSVRRQAFLEGIVPSFARQGDDLARFNEMTVTLHENALHVCRPMSS